LVPLIFESYALDLAERLARVEPQDVLEVAAGTGVLTRAMASRLFAQARIVATDLNQPMLDHAAVRQAHDGRITWRQADALALPFEDQSFDVVACQFGASAIFIEDQQAPKRCGLMAGKALVPVQVMAAKVQAAVAARNSASTFILARTDAIEPEGLDHALRRAERYLKAGADGVYVEGARSEDELRQIGAVFNSVPLATTILERGGQTPWLPPHQMHYLGFNMVLYPTSVLFRLTRAMQIGLATLKSGIPVGADDSVDMDEFENIVGLPQWAEIEDRFQHREKQERTLSRIVNAITG
jgi:SAM-dependent methyltransferase